MVTSRSPYFTSAPSVKCTSWTAPATRVVALSDGERHYNLHDVIALDRAIVGYGFSDAPMTHSADDDMHDARTFGPLQVRLSL